MDDPLEGTEHTKDEEEAHLSGPPHHCAFVDAPFGDVNLRFDCSDHASAEPARATAGWAAFAGEG